MFVLGNVELNGYHVLYDVNLNVLSDIPCSPLMRRISGQRSPSLPDTVD